MHEQSPEREVQIRLGAAHTCCYAALPGKMGRTSGRYQLGNPVEESPAGNRVVSRGSIEQSALDNQGGGSGACVAPSR